MAQSFKEVLSILQEVTGVRAVCKKDLVATLIINDHQDKQFSIRKTNGGHIESISITPEALSLQGEDLIRLCSDIISSIFVMYLAADVINGNTSAVMEKNDIVHTIYRRVAQAQAIDTIADIVDKQKNMSRQTKTCPFFSPERYTGTLSAKLTEYVNEMNRIIKLRDDVVDDKLI